MMVSGDWPGYSKTFAVSDESSVRDIAAIVVAIAVFKCRIESSAMLANYLLLLKALMLLSSLFAA